MRATLLAVIEGFHSAHSRALAAIRFRNLWNPRLVRFPLPFVDEVPDLGHRRAEEDAQEPVGCDLGPALGALQLKQVGLEVQKAGSCASRCC